jgi:uncharacterized protein (DUF1800 family)
MTTRRDDRRGRALAATVLLGFLLAACGGGGTGAPGGGGGGGGPVPPANLAYASSPVLYRTDGPVAPNAAQWTGGTPDTFSVLPALPAGLVLDPTTGTISGTPTAPATSADYTVTAENAAGSTDAVVTIEVQWVQWKSLGPQVGLTEDDHRHFLRRTHWAATDDKLAAIQAQGLPAFIDGMLAFPPIGSTPWEQAADEILKRDTDPPGQEGLFPSASQLSQWFIYLIANDANPFQEVLAMFWHDHCATASSVLDGGRTYYMKQHINLFREKGAGQLRELFADLARDWAMLWWLDGVISTASAPNENFGREWFELFALGVDNGYTQNDIVEASKAFTGYQDVVLDPATGLRQIVFNPSRHNDGPKTIFGVTIPAGGGASDYEAVVNLTIDQRDVAGWIALSLLDYFVYDQPDPVLVDQVAQLLRDENYELAPVLKAMFLSEAFYSARGREGFVKNPVEFTMGFLQATNLPLMRFVSATGTYVLDTRTYEIALETLGQEPTNPPTVNGWPGGPLWLSAQSMVTRANFVEATIADRTDQANAGIDLRDLLPPGTPSAAEVVDDLALRLGVTLDPTERTSCITYLDTYTNAAGTIFTDQPFDPNDPAHVRERVRGLLYILAQHPTYMIR